MTKHIWEVKLTGDWCWLNPNSRAATVRIHAESIVVTFAGALGPAEVGNIGWRDGRPMSSPCDQQTTWFCECSSTDGCRNPERDDPRCSVSQ